MSSEESPKIKTVTPEEAFANMMRLVIGDEPNPDEVARQAERIRELCDASRGKVLLDLLSTADPVDPSIFEAADKAIQPPIHSQFVEADSSARTEKTEQ